MEEDHMDKKLNPEQQEENYKGYKVDVWGGDLSQNHLGGLTFETWEEASEFMQERVDAGSLCNVLHTDYKAPNYKVDEEKAALLAKLKDL